MAVTVEQVPTVVLDDGYRIVEMNAAAMPWFAQHVGQDVFEVFEGSRDLFQPYYDEARRTGNVVEFAQYYGGHITHVTVTPNDDRVSVTWESLGILDTWTLEGLRASLDAALERLEALSAQLERERVRQSLHVVRGAA